VSYISSGLVIISIRVGKGSSLVGGVSSLEFWIASVVVRVSSLVGGVYSLEFWIASLVGGVASLLTCILWSGLVVAAGSPTVMSSRVSYSPSSISPRFPIIVLGFSNSTGASNITGSDSFYLSSTS